MSPLVLILLLLIVLVVAGMGIAMIYTQQAARKNRMLGVIRGQSRMPAKADKEKDVQNRRRAEIAKKLKESSELDADKNKNGHSISERLQMAGLTGVTARHYWIFSVISGCVMMGLALLLNMPLPVLTVPFMGIFGFMGLPRLLLRMKIKKRQKKFLEEFADALEAMVRLLKAGMPVSEAIKMASREFTGPVGEEMARIYEAQKIGVSLPDAAASAARRMPITEMQMFATGVAIQQQTGASLSEVLTNLAGVIRARFRLRRKVDALSSEAKASAMIIGSLPFLVGGGLYFLNTEYVMLLFTTAPGRVMVVIGIVWMTIGSLIMKAMINFKV